MKFEKCNSELTDEERLEVEILGMKEDEEYRGEFDVKRMIEYLEEKKCNFVKHMALLEKITMTYVQKIK